MALLRLLRDVASPFTPPTYKPPTPLDPFGYDEYPRHPFPAGASSMARRSSDAAVNIASIFPLEFYPSGCSRNTSCRRWRFEPPRRAPRHVRFHHQDSADEIIAFNGASYFRALGRGHTYGLSARALALNTIGAEAEELGMWIEAMGWPERLLWAIGAFRQTKQSTSSLPLL